MTNTWHRFKWHRHSCLCVFLAGNTFNQAPPTISHPPASETPPKRPEPLSIPADTKRQYEHNQNRTQNRHDGCGRSLLGGPIRHTSYFLRQARRHLSFRRLPPRKSPGHHRLCHESELIPGTFLRHRALLPHRPPRLRRWRSERQKCKPVSIGRCRPEFTAICSIAERPNRIRS